MQQQLFKSALSNRVFFDHFNGASQNMINMADLLMEAVSIEGDIEQKPQFVQIGRLRVKSNEIKRAVFTDSGKTFISPFERNDMCDLATAIDNVAGYINISARRINLYLPATITPPIKQLAGVIADLTRELEKSVNSLENLRNAQRIAEGCSNVKALEHYADQIYNTAVAALMISEPDPIELIKHNEILHALETTTDKCEKVCSVIESIIIKNS